MYTKEDLKSFKQRGVKTEQIERQLDNFKKGFSPVNLSAPATIGNGITQIAAEDEKRLIDEYDTFAAKAEILKMVPASGSATRIASKERTYVPNQKSA